MGTTRSIDDLVDLAEQNHLTPVIEGDFVEATYSAAFRFAGKNRGDRTEAELLEVMRRVCHGSIRVALLARRRARATWDMNPNDHEAANAYRRLTELAASFIPEGSAEARVYS